MEGLLEKVGEAKGKEIPIDSIKKIVKSECKSKSSLNLIYIYA